MDEKIKKVEYLGTLRFSLNGLCLVFMAFALRTAVGGVLQ